LAIWDFGVEHVNLKFGLDVARAAVHRCNVNALQFDGSHTVLSSSSDGRVSSTDLNLAGVPEASDVMLNLNPNGWTTVAEWRMAYGMAAIGSGFGGTAAASSVLVGDDAGNLFAIDPRAAAPVHSTFAAHKKKIQHIEANPVRPHLLCTSSNDRTVRMWDTRMLHARNEVAVLKVGYSVASACFSPSSGRKLLVTSLGNAIHIYNDVDILGSVSNPKPDHDLVHGHQYNRYISLTKAIWDPKDAREELFLCGRYLGEAYTVPKYPEPLLLHPIDLFSASTGTLISSLVDSAVRTVCPVNRFHPTADLVVSGTSLNLFMWGQPSEDSERLDAEGENANADARAQGDEDDVSPAEKKRRVAAQVPETTVRRSGRRARSRA
jgi:DNA damage-binding protein 2